MEESAAKEIQQVHVSIENENRETEIVKEENTSSGNKNEIAVLVKDIQSMVESTEPSILVLCRINRVPDQLRKVNEEAYTPRLIAIGPLHHFSKKLQTMEKFKLKCLRSFLQRLGTEITLEELIITVKEMEESISYCYGETIMASMHNNDFLKIILVDAIFILGLFIRPAGWVDNDDLFEAGIDLSVLMVDLVLLENQLPFFVIEKLYTIVCPFFLDHRSLIELTLCFFNKYDTESRDTREARRIEHFTDLFRTFLMPTSTSLPTTKYYWNKELRYSATELEEAGLKFQVSSSELLVDLKFKTDVNVLEIPPVELSNLTEAVFQNTIAFEQTRCAGDEFFTGYIAMLGSLIKTTEDMDLLCHHRIVDNRFHDRIVATFVVKRLYGSIIRANCSYAGSGLAADLNGFYERPWRTQLYIWMNALKRDYFCNPWRSAATIVAFILLVLTLIQAVCSVLQVK